MSSSRRSAAFYTPPPDAREPGFTRNRRLAPTRLNSLREKSLPIIGGVLLVAFFGLGLALVLASPIELPDLTAMQSGKQLAAAPQAAHIQQTLVPAQQGFSRIDFELAELSGVQSPSDVAIDLSVNHNGTWESIAGATLRAVDQRQSRFSVRFRPQEDSAGRIYRLTLEPIPPRARMAAVRLSASDWYADGALTLDGQEVDGDLAFRTYYRVGAGTRLRATVTETLSRVRLLLAVLALFLAPGLALFELSGYRGGLAIGNLAGVARLDAAQRVALWITLSLSAWIVLRVVAQMVGVPIPASAAPIAASLWLGLAGIAVLLRLRRRPTASIGLARMRSSDVAFALTFALSMLWILVVRLAQIEALDAPAWIDSVEHAQRVRTILETGSTPQQFYHCAFHFLVADLTALGGTTLAETMLVVGQVVSALAPLAVYGLARYLFGNRWSALAAAIAVGLLSIMPAFYTTWGRYPLLLGWLLFPGAVMLVLASLFAAHRSVPLAGLAGLAVAGLLFAHTRMAPLMLLLVGVAWADNVLDRRDGRQARELAWRSLGISVLPLLLILLWTIHFRGQEAASMALAERALQRCLDPIGLRDRVAEVVQGWPAYVFYGFGALGLLIAAVRGNRYATAVLAWAGVLVLSANLPPGVPGCGLVTNDLVAIGLFMPAALGWSAGLSELSALVSVRVRFRHGSGVAWLAALSLITVALLGGLGMLSILNPDTLLIRPGDTVAIQWTASHVPAEARFVVNADRWFARRFQVSDGGAWLPFLAERVVDYEVSLRVAEAVSRGELDSDGLCRDLKEAAITHVYLGQRGGAIPPALLRQNQSCFRPIFDAQGVTIAELIQ